MKPYKEVLKDQQLYHENPNINTVHRSSLIAPKINGFKTYISFLNHFLIKRGYESVFLRITPYSDEGVPSDSKSFEINKPIAYIFQLDQLSEAKNISSYEVEFFCSKNLFIPFPAVMINHVSESCINSVHSYSRTLNDLRENLKISTINVKEASFEYLNNEENGSFIIFQRGFCKNESTLLEFELYKDQQKLPIWKSKLDLNKNNFPMTSILIRLDKFFQDLPLSISKSNYSLKVKQPKQSFFYGRLLAGLFSKKDNAISANHSYYDNSSFQEYFDNKESYRTFPYFEKFSNEIIIHPIISPTKGKLLIIVNYFANNKLNNLILCEEKYEDNNKIFYFDLNKLINNFNISNI